MYYVAAALVVLAGILYGAGNNEIGAYGPTVCQYGGVFCDHPSYVFVAAILAAVWAKFVSIN
jgi:hypothetical protein